MHRERWVAGAVYGSLALKISSVSTRIRRTPASLVALDRLMPALDGADNFSAVSSFLSEMIGQSGHRRPFVLGIDGDIKAEA